MDRYELTIKIEQLNKLVRKGDYATAAKVADQIEWKKMKQWSVMSNAVDAYIAIGKYEKARNICVYAYNRNLGGRRLLITLTEMYIQLKEYDEASDVYHEFVEMAPKDLNRYSLLYKLKKAQGAPVGELIDILEEYKDKEPDEAYEYELATLYSEAGLTERCVKECDEMVLWFSEGTYVEKALRLKKAHTPLTPKQEEKLAQLERISALGLDYEQEFGKNNEVINSAEDTASADDAEILEEIENTDAEVPDMESSDTETEDAVKEEEQEEVPEERKSLKGILSIIPEGFKVKSKKPKAEEIKVDDSKIEETLEEKLAARKQAEPDLTAAVAAAMEPQQADLDELDNTTRWKPAEFMDELEEETDEKPDEIVQEESAEVVQEEWKQQEESQTEEPEIEIKVPDYSVYDTRNVQQELQASMEEIMEAYQNREEMEAARDAEYAESVFIPELVQNDEDPTKEIIINKHQWRKATRNVQYQEEVSQQKSIEAVKQPIGQNMQQLLPNQPQPAEETAADDQIEGQMDIMEWLSKLDEQAKKSNESQPVEAVEPIEKQEPIEEQEPVEEQELIEAPEQMEEVEFEEIPDVEEAAEEELGENEEPEVAEETEAELEEIEQVEKPEETEAVEEVEEAEEVENAQSSFETVQEEAAASEELPFNEETAETAGEDDFGEPLPDLEEAIHAGIERIIDDTVNRAVAESRIVEDVNNYVLKPEEKAYLEKYLYMTGMERSLSRFVGNKRLLRGDGTSMTGNAVITGNRSTDKTAFAVNLVKAIHAYDNVREQKLARIKAESLNVKGLASAKSRLIGGTLVIENAGKLSRECISELMAFMETETGGTLFILTDEEFNINKIFMENPDFAARFTGRFLLKQYSVNELVGIAKDYASERKWQIEDKALLKLYLILSKLHNDDQGNVVNSVKEIMENAGENAKNHLGNKLFKKFRSATVIKETDLEDITDED